MYGISTKESGVNQESLAWKVSRLEQRVSARHNILGLGEYFADEANFVELRFELPQGEEVAGVHNFTMRTLCFPPATMLEFQLHKDRTRRYTRAFTIDTSTAQADLLLAKELLEKIEALGLIAYHSYPNLSHIEAVIPRE